MKASEICPVCGVMTVYHPDYFKKSYEDILLNDLKRHNICHYLIEQPTEEEKMAVSYLKYCFRQGDN